MRMKIGSSVYIIALCAALYSATHQEPAATAFAVAAMVTGYVLANYRPTR